MYWLEMNVLATEVNREVKTGEGDDMSVRRDKANWMKGRRKKR